MKLQTFSTQAVTLLSHGAGAGLAVVAAGLFFDSSTVVIIGLLAMILAVYAAIVSGERAI
ncbi:hypothetical protein [Botrimarina mediterranea]|uniref:Uncharacterized protein n=1 Tax=Botrimarina mediterranea TaxID=2528022 RepID=A0A518K5X9_9BACT|nr:hypothetical protein [Botrimarina mediterranea]QDV73185.1 hypothetical protein Spa11_13790 [Botrimarina mediterranea]QDV77758.1 hypothetical protein K2D_13610 [Planctomycetes bacterium K2D]